MRIAIGSDHAGFELKESLKGFFSDLRHDAMDLGTNSLSATMLYERLAIEDVQRAAELLRPVYDQTKKRDGYVNLEVSPFLAHDTKGTLEEARTYRWRLGYHGDTGKGRHLNGWGHR